MRLAGVLLAVVLTASTAHADPLPFEIVRLLPETSQVLVFDRAHNTHVLLQPGSTFEDYTVVEVTTLEMVVEKQQQRFAVYPRDAKLLSLTVYKDEQNPAPQPPVIFSKLSPATIQVAADEVQAAVAVEAYARCSESCFVSKSTWSRILMRWGSVSLGAI